MSFVGSMLSSSNGAGFQAQAPSSAQLGAAQNNTTSAISQLQSYVNGLNTGGTNNQTSVYDQQQGTANQLQNLANGTGANPALAALNQSTGTNVANQAALMAGQRGSGGNVGLMARQAAQQGASTQQQAVGQSATLQAQQQLGALGQLQTQQQALGATAQNQVANQQTGLNSLASSSQAQQNALLGLQSNANSTNASIANTNAQGQQGLLGGALNGAGVATLGASGASLFYKGGEVPDDAPKSNLGRAQKGMVPGRPQVDHNSPQNDTVAAKLSPGEIVIPLSIINSKNPGDAAKKFVEEQLKKKDAPKSHFDTGGQVNLANVPDYNTVNASTLQFPNPTPDEQTKARIDDRIDGVKNFAANAKDVLFGDHSKDVDHFSLNDPQTPTPTPGGAQPSQSGPQNFNLGGGNGQPQQPNQGLGQIPGQAPGQFDPNSGWKTGVQGLKDEATADGQIADKNAGIYGKGVQEAQDYQAKIQKDSDAHNHEVQSIIDDLKNKKIDANQYMNNSGKVGTAIGLILGGIGGGLTHQANPALQFLNDQINRNIDAQVKDQDNKKTLLGALEKQYGDKQTAQQMIHSVYLGQVADQIQQAANQSGSAIAQARAKQAMAPLLQQIQNNSISVAQRQQALKSVQGGGDASAAIPYLVAPDKAKDATEAYGKMKELTKLEDDMNQSHQHLANETMHGALSPNDTSSAKQAFAGAVQKLSEGRYNEDAAAKIVSSMLPEKMDSAQTMNNKTMRRKQFFDAFKQEPETKLQSYGIPSPKSAAQFNKAN